MAPLDRTDREIIALLQENSRRSNREIAALVGIAESTCSVRVRRLETSGVITGYHAAINPAVLGVGLEAMLAVRLVRHTSEAIGAFWGHTSELPEATGVFHLTGPNDFLVHLLLTDANHLREVTSTVITAWPEVAHLETSVVFEHRHQARLRK